MAITLRFLGQGLQTDGNSTGNVLIESLQDNGFSNFTSFVAWAGLAGIEQLKEHIQSSNISNWNIFLGIDLKGTSKEALEALLELGVNTQIFHTVTPITYHPKIYLFEGEQKSRVIIGSSNVTERGLFNNIEGGVIIDITHPDEQGNRFIQEIKDYFSSFLNGENPNLHELTTTLIESLREQGLIPNEQERRQSHERASEEPNSTTTREATRTLFPSISMQRSPQRRRQQSQTTQREQTLQPTPIIATQTTGQDIWERKGELLWKKPNLKKSDVLQEERDETHITGELRFTQAGFKVNGVLIDQANYFRNEVFGQEGWNIVKQTPVVYAKNIPFRIRILGEDIGEHILQVKYKPSGEARQRNFTTSMPWGNVASFIRRNNLIGKDFYLYAPPEGEDRPFFIDIEGTSPSTPRGRQVGNLYEFF